MQAHQHEQNCLQIDPAMNKLIQQWTEQSIQLRNFHEHQITKENLISVAQAKVNESIRIKFEWCKHISTSKTAYKLIQQWTEQSIQLWNFHEHQITKENLISVAQAKVNEHDNWNGLGLMALCRSIVGSYADPLWAINLHKVL